MKRSILTAVLAATLPFVAFAQDAADPAPRTPMRDRMFFGGGVGLAFGDVDFVELSPLVGVRATPRLDLGLSALYRWRRDGRYDSTIDTSDYGASLFGRYRIVSNAFLEADGEYLNFEYVQNGLTTARDHAFNFLAGGGYYQPLGGRASLAFSALYNFSYDDTDPFEPYDDPWVFRAGVGVGF